MESKKKSARDPQL